MTRAVLNFGLERTRALDIQNYIRIYNYCDTRIDIPLLGARDAISSGYLLDLLCLTLTPR